MHILQVQNNFRLLALFTFSWIQVLGIPLIAAGQSIHLTALSILEDDVKETSGLIWVQDRLVTHNDSGDDPILYELNPETGTILRKVVVGDAEHLDWEDVCMDTAYIYIGDIGNNSGSRKDLVIYKISISEYLTTKNDTVSSKKIRFQYGDQIDFQPSQFQTNFDAEALVSFGDSLYIFTKNWGNQQSNIYALPKDPGDYAPLPKDSLFSDGLVTAAVVNPYTNTLVLTGYGLNNPFVIEISSLDSDDFPTGYFQKYLLTVDGSTQIEGITFQNEHNYYISAEGNFFGPAVLYDLQFPLTNIDIKKDPSLKIFPNPVKDQLNISSDEMIRATIFSSNGVKLVYSNDSTYRIADLGTGLYSIVVQDKVNKIIAVEKIVKL